MLSLTGSRGRGFASNFNGSDAEIREQLLQSLNLVNTQSAQVKSSIESFQSLIQMANQAVRNINADQNLSNSQITSHLDILSQMSQNLSVISQSLTALENAAAIIEGRIP